MKSIEVASCIQCPYLAQYNVHKYDRWYECKLLKRAKQLKLHQAVIFKLAEGDDYHTIHSTCPLPDKE